MAEYDTEKYDLPSDITSNGKLNKLRAGVLGANDGIVSTSSVVMGVAGATTNETAIVSAGLAALVAGALSMAVGEYVSVGSQSDAEKAYIREEVIDLRENPTDELDELAREYMKLGVSRKTSLLVAKELTKKDALRAHLQAHFNLDPDDINSPTQAAVASFLAFTAGGMVPFTATVLAPAESRFMITIVAVLVALFATGYISARVGKAGVTRAVARVMVGGLVAMLITYYVGARFGATIG